MLQYLGLLSLSFLSYRFLRFLVLHLRPHSLHRYNYKKNNQGPWALITGSSDGLGRAFAHELARSGFNIILHGRNPIKLEHVKKTLAEEFSSVQCRIVVADVCASEAQVLANIDAIVEELRDLNLTVLINNVGGAPSHMEPPIKPLDAHLPRDIEDMLSMNVRFPLHLTRALMPLLIRDQKPRLIINIGSIADMGMPWVSTYCGSKAFMMSWSTALGREMKAEQRNVEVLGIVPVFVTDVSFRKEAPTIMQPDANTFAKASLQKIGCGRHVVVGYWAHDVIMTILGCLPDTIVTKMFTDTARVEREKMKKST